MISFNLIEHGDINHGYGKVEFETNSPEMYRLVIDMINAISAINPGSLYTTIINSITKPSPKAPANLLFSILSAPNVGPTVFT